MTGLKLLGLSALAATMFVAGCPGESSDGDSIFNYLRGTNSADTLDNNWGVDAYPLQRMFVGSNGEVVLPFEQVNEYNHGDEGTDWYNYYRTLGAGAGAIHETDWFAQDWDYDQGYNAGSQSYNKRYQVGYNFNWPYGWLLAYDSADGMFGKPIAIRNAWTDQFSWNSFQGLVVDNSGICTVFMKATGDFGTANGTNDIEELWAIRVDMNTNTIVQDWVVVNQAFNSDDEGVDEGQFVDIEDGAIALNGDLLLAVTYTDEYDPTSAGDDYRDTLESIYYDASADTWTQARIDQVDDAGGPYEGWSFYDLDTDGKSFQIVYSDYPDNTGTEYYLWSARFIAGSATSFPTADIIDTGDDTEFFWWNYGDITFGRDGSSVVTYQMQQNATYTIYNWEASWSDEVTDPSSANSWRLTDIDADALADAFYTTENFPVVSFKNDGAGSIVFTMRNNDTASAEELYIVTFDNAGAGTQAAAGTDNIADADSVTTAGQGRNVSFSVSGYSNPQNGGVSTNVVAFTSYYWDNTAGSQEEANRVGVVLISDDTYGAAEYLQDNTVYPIEDWWLASTNDIKTGGSYNDQLDFFIDPDTVPAVGNGVVWFVFTQVTLVDGDSGQVRAHAWNWNPNTQAGAINDLTRDILTWDGDVTEIESVNPATNGAASIFLNYMGESVRVNVSPSTSGTVAGTSDGGVDVTPVDMAGGDNWFHCDGMSFKWTISATDVVTSTFQGGGYIWSIWGGHDIMSERVFGKRTR